MIILDMDMPNSCFHCMYSKLQDNNDKNLKQSLFCVLQQELVTIQNMNDKDADCPMMDLDSYKKLKEHEENISVK